MTTETQRNEAAERLREEFSSLIVQGWITKALAEERRATVERIRAAVTEYRDMFAALPHLTYEEVSIRYGDLFNILDEELRTADDSAKAAR